MKRSCAVLVSFLVAGFGFSQDIPAPHLKEDLVARWEQCRPVFRDWETMEIYADLNNPFVIGKPKDGYVRDGLKMLNFIRCLAGLPDDLELDADLNYKAQALTAINAMNGFSSHTPERPEGMPKDIYEIGYAIGQKSNLQYSITEGKNAEQYRLRDEAKWGPYPLAAERRKYLLSRATLDLVADSDYRNVFKIQHRRNIFRPQVKKVGFGTIDFYEEKPMAKDEKTDFLAERQLPEDESAYSIYYSQYLSMHIGDSSRKQITNYDYAAWPSSGYFPLEFFNYGAAMYPWSVTLNPAKYKVDDQSALSVEIAGANSGFRISFEKKDKLANYGMIGDDDVDKDNNLKKFLYFLPATASWQPSILFFPGEGKFPEAKEGDRYRVTIKGVKDIQGKAAPISYWVEFFSMGGAAWLSNSYSDD